MTARTRKLRAGEFDFFAIPGFPELSLKDKGRFRTIHASRRPAEYTIEEFLARRTPGKWVGVPRNTKYAYNKYLRNGGKMEFAEWLPSYTPTGIKKPRSEELTDRDRAMIARNVQVTKERIEAKLRRMRA